MNRKSLKNESKKDDFDTGYAFVVSLFLIAFGNWLWVITNYWSYVPDFTFSWKPYGSSGFVSVACGVLILAVAIGLLFDWYHLLTIKRASRMNRATMALLLVVGFILGFFLIGFGNWLCEFTYYTYGLYFDGQPVKIIVQPYWTEGLGLVVCGVLVLAAVSILLVDWIRLLIHGRTLPSRFYILDQY